MKSNLAVEIPKRQKLLKGLIWAIILVLAFINFSCTKECDCEDQASTPAPTSDEYYVNYVVKSSTIYTGSKMDATIRKEDNSFTTYSIYQGGSWETTIGPVAKGFTASLTVNATTTTHDKLKLYVDIYVSKNGDPFAIKKSDGSDVPRDDVSINYTIDF